MSELLAKLTNLSYEFFGVVLPGIVGSVFLLLWWAALGPLAPFWSRDIVPQFSIATFGQLVDSLTLATGIGVIIPMLAIWYFLGHLVLWIGRAGRSDAKASESWVRRVLLSLIFRIPRPANSFDPKLKPLYEVVRREFSTKDADLDWRQFYPVVKSYLSLRLTYSLVATYQNKYTFHRSVASASAALFWFSLVAAGAALLAGKINDPQPNWLLLLSLLVGSGLLVWGFSASYMFHWEMFGNSIITEAYSLLHGPKDADEPPNPKPGRH